MASTVLKLFPCLKQQMFADNTTNFRLTFICSCNRKYIHFCFLNYLFSRLHEYCQDCRLMIFCDNIQFHLYINLFLNRIIRISIDGHKFLALINVDLHYTLILGLNIKRWEEKYFLTHSIMV